MKFKAKKNSISSKHRKRAKKFGYNIIRQTFRNGLTVGSLICFIFAVLVFSQNKPNSADQALRSSGRVNPSTLGLEMDIPLGNYPGRGINVPISLSYSSKLWRIDLQEKSIPVTGGSQCVSYYYPQYGESSASGWTTSMAVPGIEYTGWNNAFNSDGFPRPLIDDFCNTSNQRTYIKRITLRMPSGETHELREDDAKYGYSDGVSKPSKNGTYYAVDGSNIKYIETSSSKKLLMPDGSFYDINAAGEGTKFTDRNGNFTQYYAPDGTYPNGYWKDTLGRDIPVPFKPLAPASPTTDQNPQIYSMPGMTGNYEFHWKKLKNTTAAESGLTDFTDQLRYGGDYYETYNNNGYVTPAFHPAGQYLFSSLTGFNDNHYVREGGIFNPIVLTEIKLPTGQSYKFSYDIYGRINKIIYPTGGMETFMHGGVLPLTPAVDVNVQDQANSGVYNRKVFESETDTTPYEWTYNTGYAAPRGYVIRMTNPDGTKTERFLHRGEQIPQNQTSINGTFGYDGYDGYDEGLTGMPYKTQTFDAADKLISKTMTHWETTSFIVYYGSGGSERTVKAHWHPRVTHEENYIYDPSGNGEYVWTTTKYEYENLATRDQPMLRKKTLQYGYQAGTGGNVSPNGNPDPNPTPVPTPNPPSSTLIRTSEATYLINDPAEPNRQSYKDKNMVGLVTASTVKDGNNNVVARSEMKYDESGYSPQDYLRGNPTTARVWDSTKGASTSLAAYIETKARFDDDGNQIESIDALGNVTTTIYDITHNAFPVKTILFAPDPNDTHGTNQVSQTETTYDFTTGLVLSVKDDFGQITKTEYNDPLLRPTRVYADNYNAPETQTIYDDPNRTVTVRTQVDSTNWNEATQYFDTLGRTIKTKTKDLEGDVVSLIEYDDVGRVLRRSNPFRADTNGTPTETVYWSKPRYDDVGRVVETFAPAVDGTTGDSLGVTSFSISHVQNFVGNVITTEDASGRKRRAIMNSFGRVLRVDEPTLHGGTADMDLGNISAPHQASSYKYDNLGNLTEITQGSQTRTFNYSSLFRITSATNPESGNNSFTYDGRGNLKTKRDARGIKTVYDYDNWGRIIKRCYRVIGTGSLGATDCASASGETVEPNSPDVSFYYDGKGLSQTANFAKGQLTKVSSSVSESLYTDFDNLGRVLSHQQITDGQTYSTAYKYNFAGALIEQTYPSGKIVRNFHDTDGKLSSVVSNGKVYASEFSRTSAGAVEKMRLGNGNWESAQFNERFQPIQIGLGNDQTGTNLWKVDYEYGEVNSGGNVDPTKNIGNLSKQILTVPGANGESGFTATQTYTYDAVNRLKTAQEKIGGNVNWKQTFNYDIYGNKNFDEANTTTLPKSCLENSVPVVCEADRKALNPNVNLANNRFASNQGYEYDDAGNVTKDSDGRTFIYDALNKQVRVKNISNQVVGDYFYDGESKRVKKTSNNENIVFVYDAFGSLIAEYTLDNQPPNQNPATTYLTTDTLGSPRVITDQNGNVVSRRDFLPFGEEILVNQNNRKTALGYNSGDGLRQKFTGYEKDSETGLEFAQNRYYSNQHGRFTSVDPLMASAKALDPQSFNRFTYVKNNPMNLVDPNGLISCDPKKEPCPVPSPKPVDVGIDDNGAVTVTVGEFVSVPPKIKGKTIFGWIMSGLNAFGNAVQEGFGFDRGTQTPTRPAPPPTMPIPSDPGPGPIEPVPGSPPDANAPDPGSGDSAGSGGGLKEVVIGLGLALMKKKIDELLNGKPLEDGYIYRKGSATDEALTPRVQDINGLSAQTNKPASGKYQTLDVGKLRAAGLLVVNDSGKHVAITPKTAGELFVWQTSRGRFKHHYTTAVQNAIVR